MSKSRLAERTTTFLAVVFLAAAVRADDLVLTDVDWVGGVEAPASGSVSMVVRSTSDIQWINTTTAADVGTMFMLDRHTIGDPVFFGFNHFLFNDPIGLTVLSIPGAGRGIDPPAVDNYHLTRITLSIDSFVTDFEPTPTFPSGRLRIDYTLNIYGLPGVVPEPSSATLSMLCLMGYGWLRLSRFRGEP